MNIIEMVKKKSKHHALCEIVKKHFEDKGYDMIFMEDNYFLDRISYKTQSPIQGECDVAGLKFTKRKRYGVVVEVTSTSKDPYKYRLQDAKNAHYYMQLYKLDKVYCIYAHGVPKDKTWSKITYKWIPQRVIDKVIIK